jgi:hypothetical protein
MLAVSRAPLITLSAKHDDVSGAGGSDHFGNVVTYTVTGGPLTIRFNSVGDTTPIKERYKLNGGASTVFGDGTTLSIATGNTLQLGEDSTSTAGTVTVTIREDATGTVLDVLTITAT